MRGPRIVEHMSQSTCQYEKNWPICADDDWVSNELWGWAQGLSVGHSWTSAGPLRRVPCSQHVVGL